MIPVKRGPIFRLAWGQDQEGVGFKIAFFQGLGQSLHGIVKFIRSKLEHLEVGGYTDLGTQVQVGLDGLSRPHVQRKMMTGGRRVRRFQPKR